jgi:DNA polymerase family B
LDWISIWEERRLRAASSVSIKYLGRNWIKGRLAFSSRIVGKYSSTLDRFGFAGLIELCGFGFPSLNLAAKCGMNRLIDSRNCYELIQRGYVIPKRSSNNHERIRTIEELVSNDRGGMIIFPQTGLHENVIVLDYDNEYANLIVNHNISYETIISNDKAKTAETREYSWCQRRLDSLKNILVCLYGTIGFYLE